MPRTPSPVGSRQSSTSSLNGHMKGMVLATAKRGRSRSQPSRPVVTGDVSAGNEPNLRVILFVMELDGKTFVPKMGGSISYDPTNDKHVDLVEKKKEQYHKKCERIGVKYELITLNATIARPLKRVGGVSRGYCRDAFPLSKKYE
jgi:hypothetical protein